MTPNLHKETLSLAYVQTVCAVAGFVAGRPPGPDMDSVDLIIRSVGPNGADGVAQLEVQVKSSTQTRHSTDVIEYDLPIKNYDDLRPGHTLIPRALLVVLLAADGDDWLTVYEHDLMSQFGAVGYWCDLAKRPAVSNTKTTRVHIPRSQVFDAQAVSALLTTRGGNP